MYKVINGSNTECVNQNSDPKCCKVQPISITNINYITSSSFSLFFFTGTGSNKIPTSGSTSYLTPQPEKNSTSETNHMKSLKACTKAWDIFFEAFGWRETFILLNARINNDKPRNTYQRGSVSHLTADYQSIAWLFHGVSSQG